MPDLTGRFANLSPAELARLSTLLRQKRSQEGAPLAIVRRDTQCAPLSFSQERLWFFHQLDPHNTTYHISEVVLVSGDLDVGVLERCFQAILERHTILRSAIVAHGDGVIQQIVPIEPWTLTHSDITAMTEQEHHAEITRLARALDSEPFDLSRPPFLRARLLRRSLTEHVLLLTMHHIISDGWSLGIMIHELQAFYTAFVQQQPAKLLPLAIQYGDFADWQRQQLRDAEHERLLSYWRTQLAGAPKESPLATQYSRSDVFSSDGAHEILVISTSSKEALQALAVAENASLFMVLLTAFKIVLCYLSQSHDIVIGTDIANRRRLETEPLIGMFVNQLVLRTQLEGNPSFRECLRRVRDVTLGADAHQDLPFHQLVQAIAPTRNLARNPLFQVLFVLQNAPLPPVNLPGLSMRLLTAELESYSAAFDLSLLLSEQSDKLVGIARYRTALFEAATIRRILYLLEETIAAVISDSGSPLHQVLGKLKHIEERYWQAERQQLRQTGQQALQQLRKRRQE
jgi:hypothetical protein